MAFNPEEHLRNLKGQKYLEVKFRVQWFREEHPEGYIKTDLVEHDPAGGLAVFRAQAGYVLDDGREVYAADYGSETRKDFGDYLEKGSTKAIGRALALLGYGTQFALELNESEREFADSPVDDRGTRADEGKKETTRTAPKKQQAAAPAPKAATTAAQAEATARRERCAALLVLDHEAAAKLPRPLAEMNDATVAELLPKLEKRRTEELPKKVIPQWEDALKKARAHLKALPESGVPNDEALYTLCTDMTVLGCLLGTRTEADGMDTTPAGEIQTALTALYKQAHAAYRAVVPAPVQAVAS